MVEQHNISATPNIPGSSGVDLEPRKDGEPEDDEKLPEYRALVCRLVRLVAMTRLYFANECTYFAPAHAIVINLVRATERRFYR